MLKELYTAIAAKLAAIVDVNNQPVFKHIELFNNQWAHLNEIKPINYPCAMIEFTDIPFEQLGSTTQQANTLIRIHVGSHQLLDNKYGSANHSDTLKHLDLIDIVNNWMTGFNGTGFNSFTRVSLSTDHDHDNLIIHVITYRTRITDQGATRNKTRILGDKLVVIPEV